MLEVRAAVTHDLASVVTIYNEGIRDRLATFETRERTLEDVAGWLNLPYPFLVALEAGNVLGWVAGAAYSERACYAGIVSFSVYIARHARAKGVGKTLMTSFIARAQAAGFSKLTSRIFPENTASLALMKSCGFRVVGIHHKHAKLDGVWRDVVVVERLLEANL